MQKGAVLHFPCQECQQTVNFSVFQLRTEDKVKCQECEFTYDFNDEKLKRQLELFENLCRQIQLSEEILSDTTIGVFTGDKEVKIPFKILLSRLNSSLCLKIGEKLLSISFRLEPLTDCCFA